MIINMRIYILQDFVHFKWEIIKMLLIFINKQKQKPMILNNKQKYNMYQEFHMEKLINFKKVHSIFNKALIMF